MRIHLNGAEHEIAREMSVDALLDAVRMPRSDIAVAVNGAVIPHSQWGTTTVRDADTVEIVTAVQGG